MKNSNSYPQDYDENNSVWKYPIKNISTYYTWEKIENSWKTYLILNTSDLINQFWDDKNAIWGKKTMATLIRKAKQWEIIITYVKNEKWEDVPESKVTAKEWQYIFQNLNNPNDIFVPQNEDIINEYESINQWDVIWDEFKLFIRKSNPSKLLPEIIKQPTVIIVESWWNTKQFLEEWATLKLEKNWSKLEVTWINKGWFEAWSLTDVNWNIVKK
ncbi:MAG: hypothetical protein ACD_49C00038G0030 [uncultured bacterium (gcode 4)]|uniref:Uncharacterized protein n=1 Tax=uncultured bacterium (gcode 4) TaxID=1234023 RepID=K2AXJ7_9BACT|nr:MAG: hypothetical protein ACD_49C00038G0030 [uncultured bacterium (gcode 4)]